MKKTSIVSFVCFLLLFSLLLVSCDSGKKPTDDTTDSEEVTTNVDTARDVTLLSNGKLTYKRIIYPSNAPEVLIKETNKLKDDLYAVLGQRLIVVSDENLSSKPTESTGEIIIGEALRVDSQKVIATLRYHDYAIVITESNIIITAYQSAYVTSAVRVFRDIISDSDNIEKDNKNVTLKWAGDVVVHNKELSDKILTVNGVGIDKYSVVYADDTSKTYAEKFRRTLGKNYDFMLPIYADTEAEKEYEILFGKVNRSEANACYTGADAVTDREYGVRIEGKKLVVTATWDFALIKALDMISLFITTGDGEFESLEAKGVQSLLPATVKPVSGEYRVMQYNVMNPDWCWDLPINLNPDGWGTADAQQRRFVSFITDIYAPDILLLNERVEEWTPFTNALDASDKYAVVSPELEGHRADSGPNPISKFDGRVNELAKFWSTQDAKGNCNPIVYNEQKFELIKSGVFDTSAPSIDDTGNENAGMRCVTWAFLKEKGNTGNEKVIAVFNTHLIPGDPVAQQAQAPYILSMIQNILQNNSADCLMIGGDMNCKNEQGSAYYKIYTGLGWKNAVNISNKIDLIATKGCTVNACFQDTSELSLYASDHKPVFIDITLD